MSFPLRLPALRNYKPLRGAVFDDFSGGANLAINNHPVQPAGDALWLQDDGNTGSLNTPQITAGGKMTGAVSGSYNNTSGHLQLPGLPRQLWMKAHFNPTIVGQIVPGAQPVRFYHEWSVISAGSYAKLTTYWSTIAGTGTLSGAYATSGAMTSDPSADSGLTAARASLNGGDTLEWKRRYEAGKLFYDTYLNGWQVAKGIVDMAATLPSITNRFGVAGSIPNTGPIDDIELGDPEQHAMITVQFPGRVVSRKYWASSSDVLIRLKGTYSLDVPTQMAVSLFNSDTEAVVTGYSSVQMDKFTARDGVWSGEITVLAADFSNSLRAHCRVERRGLIDNRVAYAWTGVFRAGVIIAGYGQSLMTQLWQGSTSVTFTPAANAFSVDGSTDGTVSDPTTRIDSRVHASNTTSTVGNTSRTGMYMLSVLGGLLGHTNLEMINGGNGGTYTAARSPGNVSGIYTRLLDGLDMASDCSVVLENGGTYDIDDHDGTNGGTFNTTQATAYKNDLISQLLGIEAVVGHPVFMILAGTPGIDGITHNTTAQAVMRARYDLIQSNGGLSGVQRFYQGGFGYDAQHNASDIYHLVGTALGYPELARRYAYDIAKLLGAVTYARTGPYITSATKNSATSITVNFELNGASGLEVANTAYASLFDGGLWFSDNDTTFAAGNIKPPTAVSIGSVSGTTQPITFTFAAASFPSTCYVRGPWGESPFNRIGDGPTYASKDVRQSMVRGIFTGEPTNIPVQPVFIGASGPDYFSAP